MSTISTCKIKFHYWEGGLTIANVVYPTELNHPLEIGLTHQGLRISWRFGGGYATCPNILIPAEDLNNPCIGPPPNTMEQKAVQSPSKCVHRMSRYSVHNVFTRRI